jgi:hypothetical protein
MQPVSVIPASVVLVVVVVVVVVIVVVVVTGDAGSISSG